MAPTMAEMDHGKFEAPALSDWTEGALPSVVAVAPALFLDDEVGDAPREPLAMPLDCCVPVLPVSCDVSPVVVASVDAIERPPKAWIAAVFVEPPAEAPAVFVTGTARPWLSVVNDTVLPFTAIADPVEASEYVVPSTVMGDPPAAIGVLLITKVGDAVDSASPAGLPLVTEPW